MSQKIKVRNATCRANYSPHTPWWDDNPWDHLTTMYARQQLFEIRLSENNSSEGAWIECVRLVNHAWSSSRHPWKTIEWCLGRNHSSGHSRIVYQGVYAAIREFTTKGKEHATLSTAHGQSKLKRKKIQQVLGLVLYDQHKSTNSMKYLSTTLVVRLPRAGWLAYPAVFPKKIKWYGESDTICLLFA